MTDKRKEQREKLLEAAYDLVAEVGVSGLRTRDIAVRAGVNIATLHYCFAGKDALLLALYEFIIGKFRELFGTRLSQAASPAEKIRVHAELRTQFLKETPKTLRVWRAFTGEAWTNDTIREIVRGHFADSRQKMAEILAAGRHDGEFPLLPTSDDRLAASMVIALFDGMLFQYAMDPDAFELQEYSGAMQTWLGMKAE